MKKFKVLLSLLGIVIIGFSVGIVFQSVMAQAESVDDWRYKDKNKITSEITYGAWHKRDVTFQYSGRTLEEIDAAGGWNYDRWQQIWRYHRIN
ncbi:MAG: hypothetical protein LBT80_06560 [Lactobacillaceae bacterium]|jgi:hypothetical protein|nr:hypothetical protein [Lactobacillaceae bacterium]